MNKCFNKAVSKILKDAEEEMLNLKHPYVGTEHLLLSLLKMAHVKAICYKHNLTYTNFRNELLNTMGSSNKKSEVILYTPLLKQVIEGAYNKSNDEHIDMNELHLLSTLLGESDGIAIRIIDNMGINTKEITNEINKPTLVNELGINLGLKSPDEKILLREKEITDVMQILLRKNKSNPLLIGKSGVGKTAVVEELARRIKNGNVPIQLKEKEIIQINTSNLIAGTKYRGEFEERVNNLIKEVVNNKKIILFIDEIHNIVKTGASDGSIDAANILKPYLARGELSIIGATTTDEYNEYIKKDAALTRRFSPIIINEPTLRDMEFILLKIKKNFEKHYSLNIPKKTLLTLIKLCDEYLPNQSNPDKCIEILDTTCSKKILEDYENGKIILPSDVEDVISNRINLCGGNNAQLKAIKSELSNIYDEKSLSKIISLMMSEQNNRHLMLEDYKELEIIQSIANKMNINLINIDCREYNDEYSLNRLLSNNYLYNQLQDDPYSILVFNNYKDSHKIIYNLVNTMLSNGYISNNKNEKLNLSKSLIFLINPNIKSSIGFHKTLLINS